MSFLSELLLRGVDGEDSGGSGSGGGSGDGTRRKRILIAALAIVVVALVSHVVYVYATRFTRTITVKRLFTGVDTTGSESSGSLDVHTMSSLHSPTAGPAAGDQRCRPAHSSSHCTQGPTRCGRRSSSLQRPQRSTSSAGAVALQSGLKWKMNFT